jgi:PAS domain S-box-containing protein
MEKTAQVKACAESELDFKNLTKAAPVGIFLTNAAGDCVYVNDKLIEISGLGYEASLGKGWIASIHPDDRERVMAESATSAANRRPLKSECRFLSVHGVTTWVLAQAQPITDSDGAILGYAGTITDITERKNVAEALRQIGLALTGTRDAGQVLRLVVEEARRLTRALFAYVVMPNKPYYRIAASAGEDRGYRDWLKLSDDPMSPFGRGPLGKAIRELRTVVCEDVLSDPDFVAWREIASAHGIRSLVAVPIVVQGIPFGALIAYSARPKAYDYETISLLTSLTAQAAAALENARLFQQTEQRAKEQAALSAIATATNQSLDLDQVLRVSLQTVKEITGRELGYIRLIDPLTGQLRVAAHEGLSEEALRKLKSPRSGGTGEKVLATGEPVVINDSEGKLLNDVTRSQGRVSVAWFPLKVQGETVGILNVATARAIPFSPGEVGLLRAIADVIGVAIGNAGLFAEAERNLARVRALHEIDTAILSSAGHEAVLKVLLEKIDLFIPCGSAMIRMWNPETQVLEPVVCQKFDERMWKTEAPGHGWGPAKAAFEARATITIRDCRSDPRVYGPEFFQRHGLVSYLGVPLIAKDNVLGVISFFTKEEHEFAAEEIEFVETLAGQAAVAIEHSLLYRDLIKREAQLQLTHKQLEALHSVTVQAAQSLDLDTVTQSVIDKITEIFDFDATRFYLYDDKRNELRVRGRFEKKPELFAGVRSFARGEGNVGRVAETGEALVFEDVSADLVYRHTSSTQTSKKGGHKFFAALPIKGRRQVLGTMVCMGVDARRLTDGELQLLTAMIGQVAVAVENASLYEEIKKRAAELQQKTWELETANRVKGEFLSVMSHELRTPLSVIMGYAGMLKEGMLGEMNRQQRDAVQKMLSRAGDQLNIINDIMQTTQLETGSVVADCHAIDVSRFLRDLAGVYGNHVDGKDVSIVWSCPPEVLTAFTDGGKLRQILQNLIGNAAKFTQKGTITVSARRAGARVEFVVTDTGIGIPRDMQEMIFEKFKQVDSSETRSFGGVGLGLYIAKEFAELLGGEIGVESEVGKGAIFTLKIPVEGVRPSRKSEQRNGPLNCVSDKADTALSAMGGLEKEKP